MRAGVHTSKTLDEEEEGADILFSDFVGTGFTKRMEGLWARAASGRVNKAS